jgi:hypothetical protein
MNEVRILAPNGMVGTGYPLDSLKAGLAWDPHVIGVDAGSTDSGPGDLGTGTCRFPRAAFKRDILHMLLAAREHGVPLIIGSAGGAGGRDNVAWTREIVLEIAAEHGLAFPMAVIFSDQDKDRLKRRLKEGRVRELGGAAPLTETTIDRSAHIVAMMGCEPIIAALDGGAEVVVCGRSSDTAVFAAYPTLKGMAPGPVWHAAKILECGAAAVEYRPSPDSLFAWVRDDHFVVRPPNAALKCTPISVAAHALYENGNPTRIIEPGGAIDLTGASYAQLDGGAVEVRGSRFEEAATYTVKLEGAELVGYQSVAVGGIADPTILADLDGFLGATRGRTRERVERTWSDLKAEDWILHYRLYGVGRTVQRGRNGKARALGGDVGVVIEVTAKTQELASGILAIARHQLLHQPVSRWKGFVSNYAFAHGATALVRGPVFRFNMNCVVVPDDPTEMFDLQFEEV